MALGNYTQIVLANALAHPPSASDLITNVNSPSPSGPINAASNAQLQLNNTSTGQVSIGRGGSQVFLESLTTTSPAGTTPTLTAAQLLGGYLIFTGQTAAVTATTDTGANIDAAVTNVATKDSFSVVFTNSNTASGTVTFVGGSNVTIRGNTGAIAITKGGTLTFVRTGAGTWDCIVQGS